MLTPNIFFRSPPDKNAVPAVAAPPALGESTQHLDALGNAQHLDALGCEVGTFHLSPDDIHIWPCGTWCYRKDAPEFRGDLRNPALHFDDCETLYVGSPEWVAAVSVSAPQHLDALGHALAVGDTVEFIDSEIVTITALLPGGPFLFNGDKTNFCCVVVLVASDCSTPAYRRGRLSLSALFASCSCSRSSRLFSFSHRLALIFITVLIAPMTTTAATASQIILIASENISVFSFSLLILANSLLALVIFHWVLVPLQAWIVNKFSGRGQS